MKILLLHGDFNTGRVDDDPGQANDIIKAMESHGHNVITGMIKDSLLEVEKLIKDNNPELVFNLVETLNGSDKNSYLIPGYIGGMGVPYTGCSETALMLTCNKVIAKKVMLGSGIATPEYIFGDDVVESSLKNLRFIVKSTSEQASFGIDSNSVVQGSDNAQRLIKEKAKQYGGMWFAERYIEGREINVSVIGTKGSPTVLPIAEIIFEGYSDDKPKIVDYNAKWISDSYEYNNTPGFFLKEEGNEEIVRKINEIATKCWKAFDLNSYVRVDFRVDKDGNPWVLEINCNPCAGDGSGFSLALKEAGVTYNQAIQNIIETAIYENNK